MPSSSPERPRIPVYKALVRDEEVAAATRCLREGWLGMGKEVGRFEAAIKEVIGAEDRHVVATSTGHAALHLAMVLAGLGPGDEVIVPSFTHLSDVQAVIAVGASPVFCDIDPLTACIDVEKAAELVGPATKALLVMDYGAHLCDHDAAAALAADYGLRVVHDAAHTFGSAYRGANVGAFSDLCMFSFDPVKTISAVDGGALVVRSEEERRRAQRLRILGSDQPAETMYQNSRTWDYDTVEDGFRYHMTNLHASIGLAQLAKLDLIRSTRQASCRLYTERLKEIDGVEVPATDFEDVNPFLYAIRVDRTVRERLRDRLAERGVDTGWHWRPAHLHSRFSGFRRGSLCVTDRVADEVISLPLHSCMADADVHRVCDEIQDLL